ncbi:MAG: gliding motility-associated C-terminal domain-containing protein [Bacteroidetes bacterium]|nr:gliding motility-associated C-terminal domain-containing protein [Bacteroidota bacterium]
MRDNLKQFKTNVQLKRSFLLFLFMSFSYLGYSQLSLPRTVDLRITNTAYNSFQYDFCGFTPNPCDIYWKPTVFQDPVGGPTLGGSFFGFDGNCNHDCEFFNNAGSSSFGQNDTIYSTTATCASTIYMEVENWEDEFCIFAPNNDGVYDAGCDVLHYISSRQSIDILNSGSGTIHNGGILGDGTPGYSITWQANVTNATNPILALTVASSTTSVCAGGTATMFFTGAASGSPTYRIYSNAGRTTLLTSATGSSVSLTPANDPRLNTVGNVFTVYVTELLTPTCETPATPVVISVLPGSNPPSVVSPVSVCVGGGAADLTASSTDAGATFNWYSGPSGGSSIWTGSTYPVNVLTNTTFYVTATNPALGCESIRVPVVVNADIVNDPPSVISPVSTCVNGQARLNASSTTAGTIFNWYSGPVGGSSVWTGSNYLTPQIAGTTTFYVTATDPTTGCESVRVPIVVNTDLSISTPTADVAPICEGTSATITASGTGGGQFNWYSDAALSNLSFIGNPFITPNLNGNTSYWLVEDINGCRSSAAQVDAVVNEKPSAGAQQEVVVCPGTSNIELSITPPAGFSVNWYYDGNLFIAQTNTITWGPIVNDHEELFYTLVSPEGCESNFSVFFINVYPNIEDPNADNLSLCTNELGVLTATAVQGDIVWYDEDGTTVLETDAGNVGELSVGPFATASTHTYFVQADNGTCQSGLVPVVVYVTDGISGNSPIAEGTTICEGESTMLMASNGTGGGVFNWYADSNLEDLLFVGNPYITKPLMGTTSFWVAETAGNCGAGSSTEVVVNVNPKPAAPNVVSETFCPSEEQTLNASPSAPAGQIVEWYSAPHPSGFIATGNSFTILSVYSRRTLYYRFVDENTGCASDFAAYDIYVNPEVEEPNTDNIILCQNAIGQIDATAVEGDIVWYDTDGTTILETDLGNVGQLQVGPFPAAGVNTYYVQVNNGTCQSGLLPVLVTVASQPAPPVISGDTIICEGDEIRLRADDNGDGVIVWYRDRALTRELFIGNTIIRDPNVDRTFYVVRRNDTCQSEAVEVNITVNPKPEPPTADPQSICFGESATLEAVGSGGIIRWYSDPLGVDFWGSGDEFTTPPLSQYTPYYMIETDRVTGCKSDPGVTWVNVDNFTYVSSATVLDNPICVGQTTTIKVASTDLFSCVKLLDFNLNEIDEICLPDGGPSSSDAEWVANFEVGPFTDAGDYIFYVQESDGIFNCPSQQFSLVVTVVEKPANPIVTNDTICAGELATVTADNGGIGEIVWYYDAALNQQAGVGISYSTIAYSNRTMYAVNKSAECKSEGVPALIVVSPKPAAPTAENESICPGQSATLEATGSGIITWYADPSGLNVIGNGVTYITPALMQNTTYYVGSQDATTGCKSSIVPVNVIVLDGAKGPSASNVTACPGEPVVLTAVGSGSGDLVWYDDMNSTLETDAMPPALQTINVGPFASAGDYVFYVSETNGDCESGKTAIVVSVIAKPTAPVVKNDTICKGGIATLRAEDDGLGEIVWYWDAALTDEAKVGFNFSFTANFTRTVWAVRRIGNCESVGTPCTVVVSPIPTAPTAENESVCPGQSATLEATGSGIITWYADPSGLNVIGTGATYITPALTQNTTYYVGSQDATTECKSLIVPVNVIVLDGAKGPSASNVTACAGEPVVLTAVGSGSGDLVWYDDMGTILETDAMPPALQTLNVGPFASAGDYVFYVSETNGDCESGKTAIVVSVIAKPTAPVVKNDTICAGQLATVGALDNGLGDIIWYWDAALTTEAKFGFNFSFTANVTRTVYAVRRIGNCQSTAVAATVLVNPKPETPVVPPTFACAGSSATLEVEDTDNEGVVFWFSDPLGADLWEVGNEFTTPSLFQYTPYYVFRKDTTTGCISDVGTTWVIVDNFTYVSSATVVDNPICTGETGIIKVATTDIFSCVQLYDWNFDLVDEICLPDDDPDETDEEWVADFEVGPFDAPGEYIFYVQESDGFLFCPSQQLSVLIIVKDGPEAPTVSNDGPACEGEDVMVMASTVPGATYLWNGPNGFSSTEQNFVLNNVTIANAGDYFVTVKIGNCTSQSAVTKVVVYPVPSIVGEPTSNSPLCEGETLELNAEVLNPDGLEFEWTGPNGFESSIQSPTIANVTEADNQGFYTVVVTDKITGCSSDPKSVLVSINRAPTGVSATNSGPACEGEDIKLSASYVFGASYEWSGPNAFTSTDRNPILENVLVVDAGTYSVIVSIGDCSSEPVSTDVVVYPTPSASAGNDITIIQGSSTQLNGNGGITYTWTPSDYLDHPNLPNPVATPPIGVWTYVLTVTNEFGCSDQDSVVVTVLPNLVPETVNLITPNGDGINDYFTIDYLENIGDYTLAIYARGGVRILETAAYANDWNGTYKGKDLPDGTYWYVIRTSEKEFKGAITIKR